MDGLKILQSLPESVLQDVLPKVVKYLSRTDRNNWRLASKSMYKCCTCPEVTKHEKFIFYVGPYLFSQHKQSTAELLTEHILNCQKIRPAIEFVGLNLTELPLTVWAHFGEKIRSLKIYECSVNDDVLVDIIMYCTNLKHFRLESNTGPLDEVFRWGSTPHPLAVCFHSEDTSDPLDKVFFSEGMLDNLIDAKVERPQLKCLELFTHPISEASFQKLNIIFPRVETFGRTLWPNSFESYRINDDTEVIINNLVDSFSTREKITKIELRIWEDSEDSEDSEVYDSKVKKLMFRTLKSSSALKAFKFHSSSVGISFTRAEFVEFAEAIRNLESLDLMFPYFKIASGEQKWYWRNWQQFPPITYNLLKYFRLSFTSCIGRGNSITLQILQQCPALQHLDLGGHSIDNNILKCIFKNQIELRTLYINCTNCSREYFAGKYNISRLKNLENLKIYLNSDSPEEFLDKFNCRKLKSFHVGRISNKAAFILLDVLSSRSPRLETLSFNTKPYVISPDPPIKNKFQNLRFLFINWIYGGFDDEMLEISQSDDEMLERLFNDYPSLTYVICETTVPFDNVFTFDRISKSLLHRKDEDDD